MKRILIVIDSLSRGGTEISLINMLKLVSQYKQFDIFLLPLVDDGPLLKDVPSNINIITIDKDKQMLLKPLRTQLRNNKSFINKAILYLKIIKYSKCKLRLQKGERIRYNVIKSLDNNNQIFDVAIAYTDSSSLFYVAENVNALKKYVWVHMDYTKKNNRPMLHNYFYEKMDKIICVSIKSKQSFDKLNPNLSNKTNVIHSLLDIQKIDALKNEKNNEFDNEYFNILSVGRLNPEKNFDNLIKIFSSIITNTKKKIRLYIIGSGPEENKLKQLIVENKIEDKCFLLGEKSNPYKYMNNCDLYVQCSIREGFGLTLYEAKYLKKVILSTRVAATDEIFTNKKDAIIVDNDNVQIAMQLIELINNDKLRESIKKNLNSIELINDRNKILKILRGD